jgi:hypothetical protein
VVAGALHDSHRDLTEGLAQSSLTSVKLPLQGLALGDIYLSNLVEWGAPSKLPTVEARGLVPGATPQVAANLLAAPVGSASPRR